MAKQPSKEDMMAYLYGELNEIEKNEIDDWLKNNPTESIEMESFDQIRDVLGSVEDKQIVDPIFSTNHSGGLTIYQSAKLVGRYILRPLTGLAAAITLMFVVGYATNFSISGSDGQTTISFGDPQNVIDSNPLDQMEIETLVRNIIIEETDQIQIDVDEMGSLLAGLQSETKPVDQNAILTKYMEQIKQDNLDYLEQYLDLSNSNQEKYLQASLREFSDFLDKRREEDLVMIEYSLTSLKQTQDLQKLETDQALASIVNTVNLSTQNQ